MKSWTAELVAFVLAWLLLCGAVAFGEIIEVPPIRPQDGEGILAQLQVRLPRGLTVSPGYESNIGMGHGNTHDLNSHIRNKLSPYGSFSTGNAAYFYGGWAWVFPDFPVRISEAQQLARCTVPSWGHDAANNWEHHSGYVADELSAYLAGTAAGIENGWNREHTLDGSLRGAIACYRVLHAIGHLCRQRGYPAERQAELDYVLIWARQYIEQLETMQ